MGGGGTGDGLERSWKLERGLVETGSWRVEKAARVTGSGKEN